MGNPVIYCSEQFLIRLVDADTAAFHDTLKALIVAWMRLCWSLISPRRLSLVRLPFRLSFAAQSSRVGANHVVAAGAWEQLGL